jgi:phosphopantetheine adenylyltransferase
LHAYHVYMRLQCVNFSAYLGPCEASISHSDQVGPCCADSKLLEGKRYRGLIQDYDQRVSSVLGFLQDVCPSIDPVIMRLTDPDVPTRAETEDFMNAIVVSQETLKGGVKINNGRVKLGFKELVTIVVPVLGAMASEGEKLSSTALREADARKQRSR